MPPLCLPEVARKSLNTHGYFKNLRDSGILQVESRILIGARHRIVWSAPFPVTYGPRHFFQRAWIKTHDLSDFFRCGLRTIGDDIRSHCSAEFSVASIDILDGLLSLII